jgi:hypothetical protein
MENLFTVWEKPSATLVERSGASTAGRLEEKNIERNSLSGRTGKKPGR